MSKSAEAFRTISEVAEWLDTPTHVLRFWESKFPQVKPVKRAGGRRYYRPADMELLSGIKKLLHEDGVTIRGVQKILREQGVRHVCALSEREIEGYERPVVTDSLVSAKPRPTAPTPEQTAERPKVVSLRPPTTIKAVPNPEPIVASIPVPEQESTNIFVDADTMAPSLFDNLPEADPESVLESIPAPASIAAPPAEPEPVAPPRPAPLPPASPPRSNTVSNTLRNLQDADPAHLTASAGALSAPLSQLKALRARIAQSLSQKP